MIRKIILTSFSLLWIFIIFYEYLYQHSAYADAVGNFQYYGFLIPFLCGIGGFAYLRYRDKGKPASYKALNGLGIFGISYLMVLIITAIFFSKYEGADFTPKGAGQLTIYFIGVALAVYLTIGFVFLLGDLLLILFPLRMAPRELFITKIGVGIMVLVALMFLLGSMHVLYAPVIMLLFFLILFLNLKGGKEFVQTTLWKPIELSPQLNLLGIVSFGVVLLFVTLNFTQVVRPIAIGFDAMTLYMRIPSLMGDYHGLIQGHGTYNWSIFMSLGTVVFNSTAVTLALSFIGGPLALMALYALSRRWMNTNLSLLVLALLYTMPQINFLSFQDMKIDLGLLFISLCTLIFLVNWITPVVEAEIETSDARRQTIDPKSETRNSKQRTKKKSPTRKRKPQQKTSSYAWLQSPAFLVKLSDKIDKNTPKILQGQGMMAWLGLMVGFAIGIKVTSVMLLLGLFAVIWFIKGNAWSSLGVMLLCLATIFIIQLDKQSGTRDWHASIEVLQWILAGLGIAILAWQTVKNPQQVLANVKRSIVIVIFFMVAMSPWFVKNISETGSLRMDAMLNGRKAIPNLTMPSMKELEEPQN